jgi:Kef-type K+ transport system membrane component KefB
LVSAGGTLHGAASLLALDPASRWVPVVHVASTIGLIAGTLLVGPLVLRAMLRRKNRLFGWDASFAVHLVFLVIVSGGCVWLGVNPMFGGLTAGLVAGRELRRHGIAQPKSLELAGLKFFVPIYFALVGARLDLIHHFDAVSFVVFLAFACVVKGLSIYGGARAAGESHSAALNLATALNARGGPGIVLAAVTYDAGIINESFFAILVLTAVVTSLAAGSWLGRVVRSGVPLRGKARSWSRERVAVTRAGSATGR